MRAFPRYWATHRQVVTLEDGEFDLVMRGSSDISQEDAERDARRRFDQIVAAGGPMRWPRDEYYPDRRLPEELLDEVHSATGELIAVITRNRYGSAVLNTDAVLITDIDIRSITALRMDAAQAARRGRGRTASSGGGGFFSRLLGRGTRHEPAPGGNDTQDPDELGLPGRGARGEEHHRILALIDGFRAAHPELGTRTYRTRNGFRVIVTGTGAGPQSDRAKELMAEMRSDGLYMMLCRVHDTYRARLTPKPWRVGIRRTDSSWPGADEAWVRKYDEASRSVAVCRFLDASGPAPSADEQQIIDLHDRAVRAESGLRLA